MLLMGTADGWLILSENILSVSFKYACLFQKDVGCVMYSTHTQIRRNTEVRFNRAV
jgi:hypothetical protein